jgi:hypothetical protein
MDKAGLIPESSDPDLFIPATKSIPRPSVQNNNIIVLDSDQEDDEDEENYPDQNYEDDVDAMMTEEKGDDEEISSLNVEIKSMDNEIASLVALRSSLRTKLASAKSRQSDRTASSSTLAVKSNTSKKVLKLLVFSSSPHMHSTDASVHAAFNPGGGYRDRLYSRKLRME